MINHMRIRHWFETTKQISNTSPLHHELKSLTHNKKIKRVDPPYEDLSELQKINPASANKSQASSATHGRWDETILLNNISLVSATTKAYLEGSYPKKRNSSFQNQTRLLMGLDKILSTIFDPPLLPKS